MRIAHVITRLIVGGAQENTLHTVEDLHERHGDEVLLITGPTEGPEGNLLDPAKHKALDVRPCPELIRPIRPRSDYSAYRHLRRLFAEYRPDVVHTHSSKAGIVGRAAARACDVPAIVHTVHGLAFDRFRPWWNNRVYITAERWAARRCHRILCVADAMTDAAVEAGIGPREMFRTVYSGMDVEPFLNPPRSRAQVRGELGFADSDLVVGKVARLFEFKGHDDVIDAATTLAPRFPGLRFLFVGGGDWRKRLQSRVQDAGLRDRFVFTGLVSPKRIPELIHATDVVAHASYREGLARVLPQALVSGKPVVSYDVGGAREVVLRERTGELVAAGDVAGLTAGLERLLRDAERRAAYGRTGRELFTDRFRHEHMTARIRENYEEILAGSVSTDKPGGSCRGER